MPEHSTLTDPNLHEPKGVSTASNLGLYHANGSGSGSWIKTLGFGQYQDSRRTVGTPAQTLTAGVRTKFICNGAFLTKERLPSDAVNPLWNVSTNKHAPIREDDVYEFRVTFTAQNYSGANPYLDCELDIGGSIGVILGETKSLVKSGAAMNLKFSDTVFTGSTYVPNGGEIYLTYQGSGTCVIYNNSVMISRLQRNT